MAKQTLTDADIIELAKGPRSFSVEGLSQSNRDPMELLKLRNAMRKSRAAANPAACIFGTRIVPPGP